MNSKTTLFVISAILFLSACKKEKEVDFSHNGVIENTGGGGEPVNPPVSGTHWTAVNTPTTNNSHVFTLASIPEVMVYTMVTSNSTWGYFTGGTFYGTNYEPSSFGTFNRMQIVDGTIYAMTNTSGTQNVWSYDPTGSLGYGWEVPSTLYFSETPIQSLEVYDERYFLATFAAPYVRMYNSSGFSYDQTGEAFNASVSSLKKFNGRLIAGGNFTAAGSTPLNYVAAWDGTSWQPLGSGLNGKVSMLEVYNGKLIAIGSFTANGEGDANCRGIAMWDGTSWKPLGTGIPVNANGMRNILVNGNQLFVAGDFDYAGGVLSPYIAKWNGTSWSSVGGGAPYIVGPMTVFDGKLYIANQFTTGNGSNFLLRLD